MDKLPLAKLNIPTRISEDFQAFGDNVYRAVQELGLDPFVMVRLPMFGALAKSFKDGSSTKAQFQNAVNNLAILRGLK